MACKHVDAERMLSATLEARGKADCLKNSGRLAALNQYIVKTAHSAMRDEPPPKISKLAISAESEEDRYDTTTKVICYECQAEDVPKTSGNLQAVVEGVMKATTFARQEEVKAWEQEFTPCEHTLCLEQQPSKQIESQELGKCSMCDLKENLWLCLECGNLGCGRAQWGGVGGNSHGLAHTDAVGHGVAVKLGSITPEGNADVYCYKCNEERIDPELTSHLAHWGINVADREKTEKSLMEMQVEQNLKWDFSMTTEDGKELKPLFGTGFTGLKNIGNSCYLASAVQCLFSLPEFHKRYFLPNEPPPSVDIPAEDMETQMRKLGDGLLSGDYSHPDTDIIAQPDTPEVPHQKGLSPAMFKHLIGRGHEEFSTMRQQDSFEFLTHLFKHISLSKHPSPEADPVASFRFALEQRLQCMSCKRVRYRVDEQDNISIPVPARRKPASSEAEKGDEFESVTLKECLDIFTAADTVEFTCPSCNSKDGFLKQSKFKTFPQNLAINARRFELVNWVPTKLDIPVQVTDEPYDMTTYMSHGLQRGEEELPEDASSAGTSNTFVPNEIALSSLEAMGFPRVRCEKALHATGNSDPEAAMNWLFAHMEDPDIDEPLNLGSSSGGISGLSEAADPSKIDILADMGISAPQARKALKETGGNVERAIDWVFSHPDDQGDFGDDQPSNSASTEVSSEKKLPGTTSTPANFELQSIVCHKGASIHAGHYVAFIRKEIPDEGNKRAWVLFNDEKVVKAADVDEMKKFAYVYFFRRV
ncbi:putative ubiquitin c-terminal hydrolase [Phaeomoniella chlamydospora]|uniref:Ubiquitin carboxyl-terminal hydrolase n=1 Tax=Phaeomoniella chlamydospora TaxID=158046 RepID=A0A0G2EJL1_PHACM|nr:putative ubiquitin c-terminal hydrolase [Phaeomoniella chlamydospora]